MSNTVKFPKLQLRWVVQDDLIYKGLLASNLYDIVCNASQMAFLLACVIKYKIISVDKCLYGRLMFLNILLLFIII